MDRINGINKTVSEKIIALLSLLVSTKEVPLVFEKDGFRFAFYSNDHRPIHVHVRKAGAEAIFDVEGEVELRESQGFKIKDLNKAQQLAEENKHIIIQKWNEHIGR